MTANQTLQMRLNRSYLAKLVRDPDALAFFLSVSADAEGNGEGALFAKLSSWLEKNGHPKLAKIVEAHAADEVRHEKLLLDTIASLGREPSEVPSHVKIIEALGKRTDHLWDREPETAEDVAKIYLLLYAIERRAIERFAFMVEALEPVHPEIAKTFASIAKDERTHLRYCVAVSRAVLPDEAAWTKLRDEMVALEAVEYTENALRWQTHILDNVFRTLSAPERFFWKSAQRIASGLGAVQTVLPIGGAEELPSGRMAATAAAA